MTSVTYPQIVVIIGVIISVVTFVSPTLDRINRLETQAEILNVKLNNFNHSLDKISNAYEQLASQGRGGGPNSTPSPHR